MICCWIKGRISTFDPYYSWIPYLTIYTYLLKFIGNPKSIIVVFSLQYTDKHRAVKILSHPVHTFPAEVKQGSALPCLLVSTLIL